MAIHRTVPFIRRQILSPLFVLYLAAGYLLVVVPLRPEILSSGNLTAVAVSAAPLVALAIGQTFVVITGGIDLSLTALVSLASVVGAWAMTGVAAESASHSIITGVVCVGCVGLAAGFGHGVSVAWLRMPPFLVTLVSLMFLDGLAQLLTSSRPIGNLPDAFLDLAYTGFILPWPVLIVAIAAVLAHLLLRQTVFGKQLYAVGQNLNTARAAGLPTARTIILAYMLSGLFAAIATLLYMMRLETGKPDLVAESVLLDCIAAVVIGGTSLRGGHGTIVGTVLGSAFITLIGNSLNLFGNLKVWHVLLVKGGVILFAAGLESIRAELVAREGVAT